MRDPNADRKPDPAEPESDPTGPFDLRPGDVIDIYRIGDRLGHGGMADVYAATQTDLNRPVALKVLRAHLATDATHVRRFRREARAAARLDHPAVVRIHRVGSDPIEFADASADRPAWTAHYIAQELVEGPNLRQRLASDGPFPPHEVRRVLSAIAEALTAADAVGIVHRDIKPENILVDGDRYRVADFGLARFVESESLSGAMTRTGMTLGTPRYMAPEQIRGGTIDIRTDLYAAGVTAYHLWTGRPPFDADDPLTLAMAHLNDEPPPPPDDDPELRRIVERLLRKRPGDRYTHPTELGTDLDSGVGSSRTPSRTDALVRWSAATSDRRRRFRSNFVRAAALISALVGGWTLGRADSGDATGEFRSVLRPDDSGAVLPIAEQYLAAMVRNEVEGWRTVWDHPATKVAADRTAVRYAAKARLQAARILHREGRWSEAAEIVKSIRDDEMLADDYGYLAEAWSRPPDRWEEPELGQFRIRYRRVLQNDPSTADLFLRTLPEGLAAKIRFPL